MSHTTPTDQTATVNTAPQLPPRPWAALVALLFGFFMILVDSTIVIVANPAILRELHTDITSVIWVTSAYLLAYAVPMLITGRLGDRFGQRNIYLIGLTIFTLSSVWCGLAGTIAVLIVARVVQGIGASLMAPQTLAVITRIFPPANRGKALGIWGSVAGIATLVGPILGGVLVDGPGWPWIFFVNAPVGVAGFLLAARFVPKLPPHPHHFDWLGLALSAVGMFLLVFGLQEGPHYNWGVISGPITVWGLIIVGVIVLVGFVLWEAFTRSEPLMPLRLFRDRDFSVSNLAMVIMGVYTVAMPIPTMFYFQVVLGATPTNAALLISPMAIVTLILAPLVGTKLLGRYPPGLISGVGFLFNAIGLLWLIALIKPDQSQFLLLLPAAVMGVGMACTWAPLSASATRNLPPNLAGAGAGVYNTTRQVGAVLGSAATSSLVTSRLAAHLPNLPASAVEGGSGTVGVKLPDVIAGPMSSALAESLWLPAIGILVGIIVVLFLRWPKKTDAATGRVGERTTAGTNSAPVAVIAE